MDISNLDFIKKVKRIKKKIDEANLKKDEFGRKKYNAFMNIDNESKFVYWYEDPIIYCKREKGSLKICDENCIDYYPMHSGYTCTKSEKEIYEKSKER